ncbi:MAG: hypothetical protein PHG49_03480 [Candidatus Pacebacteria bacterium]|nr:hypothetical protein [Candidatus Paceibacterota bacterium]
MLERINQFWPSIIIFVNCFEKPYFRFSEPPYLNERREIVLTSLKDLANFNIDNNILENTEQLIEKYISSAIKVHDIQNKGVNVKFSPMSFNFSNNKFSKIEKIIKKLIN